MISIKLWFEDLNTCDLVFNELVKQGYNLEQKKVNNDWQLEVNWENVDLDPNKKYILPMDGTGTRHVYQKYAVMNVLRSWEVFSAQGDDEAQRNGYTVTAKDIEDAPEWVKALEPVEV